MKQIVRQSLIVWLVVLLLCSVLAGCGGPVEQAVEADERDASSSSSPVPAQNSAISAPDAKAESETSETQLANAPTPAEQGGGGVALELTLPSSDPFTIQQVLIDNGIRVADIRSIDLSVESGTSITLTDAAIIAECWEHTGSVWLLANAENDNIMMGGAVSITLHLSDGNYVPIWLGAYATLGVNGDLLTYGEGDVQPFFTIWKEHGGSQQEEPNPVAQGIDNIELTEDDVRVFLAGHYSQYTVESVTVEGYVVNVVLDPTAEDFIEEIATSISRAFDLGTNGVIYVYAGEAGIGVILD